MIGVVTHSSEHAVVREFFELFKVPWEFYRKGGRYAALLCTQDEIPDDDTSMVLIYSDQQLRFDVEEQIPITSQGGNRVLVFEGTRIPIYGNSILFPTNPNSCIMEDESGQSAAYLRHSGGKTVVRIGYDLFHEIRFLLTAGQPARNAAIPALELHIALLRDLIIANGIPLVEIPPVPAGCQLIACLTHDVDHPSIRRHKFDHTTIGFMYRALLGSLFGALRGRVPLRNLLGNWAAALKLPFVHLGLAEDIWEQDFNRYLKVENGLHSSFFFIPLKDYPGRSGKGQAPRRRAARYAAAEFSDQIKKLILAGCEVGLHGMDAWIDSSRGREELDEIRRLTGTQQIGVRMHWLYFDKESAATLESAGADYDSTIGYNETVGYRAGTTQAYKPLQTSRMLELPMHVMDTALFFPGYLGCSLAEARHKISAIVDNAVRLGGAITVNWHDRSLAPERLWGDCYAGVLDELKTKQAWFATANQAVAWFRKRRSAEFKDVRWDSGDLHLKIVAERDDRLPDLKIRVHNGRESHQDTVIRTTGSQVATDVCIQQAIVA